MPVGVFEGHPSRAGAIFTGGKSAIDLIGLGRAGAIWLLELKTSRNIKVGALSELFFYSMVLHDATTFSLLRKTSGTPVDNHTGPTFALQPTSMRGLPVRSVSNRF